MGASKKHFGSLLRENENEEEAMNIVKDSDHMEDRLVLLPGSMIEYTDEEKGGKKKEKQRNGSKMDDDDDDDDNDNDDNDNSSSDEASNDDHDLQQRRKKRKKRRVLDDDDGSDADDEDEHDWKVLNEQLEAKLLTFSSTPRPRWLTLANLDLIK